MYAYSMDCPSYLSDDVIKLPSIPLPKRVTLIDRASNAGYFDALPLELCHSVLDLLDPQTIATVSYLNYKLYTIVSALKFFAEITAHAWRVLKIQTVTGTISHFSAARLQAVLRSDAASTAPPTIGLSLCSTQLLRKNTTVSCAKRPNIYHSCA